MKKFVVLLLFNFSSFIFISAQPDRWQQRVKYTMVADVDVTTNRITGTQKIAYTNNSLDRLDRVFFHLYWNAFQPGSQMDIRSQELGKTMVNGRPDWDPRVQDRISKLTPEEIGYQQVKSLKMDGVEQRLTLHGTILEVVLTKPILSKSTVNFEVIFEAQVPLQVRRSGRDNKEGIRYSMSQWYPKICEYDYQGWHPSQYVAREFYGVWGDFDVTIKIDKSYKLAGTGVLQNASEIGWGYDRAGTPLKSITAAKRTWHFVGNNVHDFVWAADPDYGHIVRRKNGVTIHVVHKKVDSLESNWENVADAAEIVLPYIEKRFGKYPYPQYSFIQGGDGGMEYPMATLVKSASLGTAIHEWMHSWYQMILGTNENLYPWMDEGFASFAEEEVKSFYYDAMNVQSEEQQKLPLKHAAAYGSYFFLVKLKLDEPLSTHSDHYNTNVGYSVNAYSKGEIFLTQLGYIVGESVRDRILLEYYDRWKFKHPNANDFVKVAQDVSGMQLNWYKEYWVYTTKNIDYAIDSLWQEGDVSKIRLRRMANMPMPVDIQLTFKDGSKENHYVPLDLMFGNKPVEGGGERIIHDEWNWTNPTYVVEFRRPLTDLVVAEIDPTKRMADIDKKNNTLKLNW